MFESLYIRPIVLSFLIEDCFVYPILSVESGWETVGSIEELMMVLTSF